MSDKGVARLPIHFFNIKEGIPSGPEVVDEGILEQTLWMVSSLIKGCCPIGLPRGVLLEAKDI